MDSTVTAYLGVHEGTVDAALERMHTDHIVERLWAIDWRIWSDDPADIANRLGWLQSPFNMLSAVPEIEAFVDEVGRAGYTQALLMGMGGSSLAPELYSQTFGSARGFLRLWVLDSTDPGAVLAYTDALVPAETLFIVSSKSGTTVEPLSFMNYFYNLAEQLLGVGQAGEHFVAITDPGSLLAQQAVQYGFRRCFVNDPNIGGRYSALSYFGLVAAALVGVDLRELLYRAGGMARRCRASCEPVTGDNPGFWLGAVLGSLTLSGRDKLTLVTSPALGAFGAWLEQLIAESTGKLGKGILPVDGETPLNLAAYGNDRLFVYLRLDGDTNQDEAVGQLIEAGQPVVQIDLGDVYDLGREFFRWEVATAVAAHLMGVNPFNQPNVESAKKAARAATDAYKSTRRLPELEPSAQDEGLVAYSNMPVGSPEQALANLLALVRPGDYIALQAYLPPTRETTAALQRLRLALRDRYRVATTVGYGPRFLHSTGQLHKGDGNTGVFLQLTADAARDVPIPDEAGKDASSMTFGVLEAAQALGDRQALLDGGRRFLRLHLKGDVEAGLARLLKAVQ